MIRAGVIRNPRSRRNQEGGGRAGIPDGVLCAAPPTRQALDATLADYAAEGIDLLVIDGGDGTVREVLTRAPEHFGARLPPVAVLPSGKTNALAIDLGAPIGWSLEAAMEAARGGRLTQRAPLEVTRDGADAPFVRGFLLGAGAFVHATDLAQRHHRLGVFDNLAIALTLGGAAVRTLLGGPRSRWRAGVPMRIGEEDPGPRSIYLLLASSLKRLPLGVEPFGPPSPELQILVVQAPPRRLIRALPILLRGAEADWLEPAGYRRRTLAAFDLDLEDRFVLDGEPFAGGALRVAQGPPLAFVKP